jgi:hypothetical protein
VNNAQSLADKDIQAFCTYHPRICPSQSLHVFLHQGLVVLHHFQLTNSGLTHYPALKIFFMNKTKNKNPFLIFSSHTFWLRIIIICQMGLLGLQFAPNISTNGDDAVYYILGKSLATGQGYHNIHLTGSPVSTQYPVVFPAILAVTHFFTNNPLSAKILVMCMGLLVTIASFYLFKSWAMWYITPLVFLTGSSAVLNQHAIELLSEIPYLLLSLLSLLLLEKSYKNPNKKWLFWLTIFVSVLPMNCRSIGMAFSGAFLVANLLNKKFRYVFAHIIVLVATIIFYKMLTSWNTPYIIQLFQINSYDPDQGYASISEMITRFTTNVSVYSSSILPEAFIPSFTHANQGPANILGVLMSLLIGIGCIRNFFLPSRFISFYIVFYCGILSLWQTQWSSGRFLAGIMPFLFFLFFAGISTLWEFCIKAGGHASTYLRSLFVNNYLSSISRTHTLILLAIAMLFAFDNTSMQIQNCDQRKQSTNDWANFNSCADWLRLNTPKDAIVVSRKAELVYLRSNRQGMLYPYSRDREKVIAEIKKQHATYILCDGFYWTGTTQRYLYPALAAHPEMYRIVYALRNPDTFVLQIIDK